MKNSRTHVKRAIALAIDGVERVRTTIKLVQIFRAQHRRELSLLATEPRIG